MERQLVFFNEDSFPDRPSEVKELPKRKVNVPATSREAHESVKELKGEMYPIIIKALEEMKVGGTSEQIAEHLGVKHEKVWKRLKEMIDSGTLYNVGITRKTSSGRKSMVRQLVSLKPILIAK